MADHRIGRTYVEVALDYTPFDRSTRLLKKDALQVSRNIEKNFNDLGIRSAKTFDLMRARVINSYNMIAASGKATANDLIRAEQAKANKIRQINEQQFGHTTSTLDKLKKHWKAYSVGAMAALYAINRFVQKASEEFKNYETALIDMAKVTDQSLEVIDESIKNLDSSLGDSTALMKGYYQVISAGVTEPKAAMDLLITAAKASKAAHLDQSEVIKALTKLMKGYEGEIKSTEEAADLLFTTEKLGQTTVAELVPVIGDIAKASKEAGVSHMEMAAAMALITQTAGDTSSAATQYKSILMGLLRPNEQLTKLTQQYGFETGVAMVKTLGFSETLRLIRKGAADSNIQIGKLFRSSEGMIGLAALGASNFEEYNELIKKMGEGAGSSAEAFDRFLKSAQAVDDELSTNFKKLLIEIGEYIEPFAHKIKHILSAAFAELAENIHKASTREEFWGNWVKENITQIGEAWIIVKTEQGEVLVRQEDVDNYLKSLQKGAEITKGLGDSFVNAKLQDEALKKSLKETNDILKEYYDNLAKSKAELEKFGKRFDTVFNASLTKLEKLMDDAKSAMDRLILATSSGSEIIHLEYQKLHSDLDKYGALIGKTTDEISKMHDALDLKENEKLKDYFTIDFKGTSFGNELADGINNAMISMHSLNDLFDEYAKKQKEIYEMAKTSTASAKQIHAAQKALDDSYFKAQISGYRQLFGTVSQLFDENSKERETLHKAEMAFAVVELAMSAKKMVVDAAGTVMAIANSAKRCVAWGVEAVAAAVAGIAGQATGDPYTAFARIAAMIALMGSVLAMAGKAFGGGGSSGHTTGGVMAHTAGTVLGDKEKASESLQHSLDLMEEYHVEDYTELVGIHNELIELNKNITGLVANIVRGFGTFESGSRAFNDKIGWAGVNESFLNLNESIIAWHDKLAGSFSSLGDRLTIALSRFAGKIVTWLGETLFGGKVTQKVTGAGIATGPATVGGVLAGEYPTVQAYYDIKRKTSGGLFGRDKTKKWTEFEAVDADVERLFQQIYGNISNMLVYLAEGFNVSAEKMAEVFAYEFAAMKLDLKGLTGEEITEKINAWISTIGDEAVKALFDEIVGKYQQVDEGMMETAIRLLAQKEILFSVFEVLNLSFDDTTTSAIDFSQAIIALAEDFDSLLEDMGNYYDKFFTEAEQQEDSLKSLAKGLADINVALPATRDGFRDLVESLDLTTEAGKEAFVALMAAADQADAWYTYQEGVIASMTKTGVTGEELTTALDALADAMLEAGMTAEDVAEMMLSAQDKIMDSIEDIKKRAENYGKTAMEVILEKHPEWASITYEQWAATDLTGWSVEMLQEWRNFGDLLETQWEEMQDALRNNTDAINELSAQQQEELTVLERLIAAFISATDAIIDYQESLLASAVGMLSPDVQYAQASSQLTKAVQDLYSKDKETALAAVEAIPDYVRQFLEASKAFSATPEQYMTDFARAMTILNTAEGIGAKWIKDLQQYIIGPYFASGIGAGSKATYVQPLPDGCTITPYGISCIDPETGKGYFPGAAALKPGFTAGMQCGGIISGPETGYIAPITFHGTEHIVPGDQMGEVKEVLKDVKGILIQLRDTNGDQNLTNKKLYRIIDRVSQGEEYLMTKVV